MDSSGLQQVERQRQELEANIHKLRKSLQHWQTSEIEYEGLREEIASLPDGSSTDDILAIARDFRADLVDDKELQSIIGGDRGNVRNQSQIVDLLAKRVDYVSRNARTIEKQLSDAQKKRNALLLAEEPDFREDAGLPLADITEELDDEGNIVARKVETPGSKAPQLIDVLKKAGVKDVLEHDGIVASSKNSAEGVTSSEHDSPTEDFKSTSVSSETAGGVVDDVIANEEGSQTSRREESGKIEEPISGQEDRKREERPAPTMSGVNGIAFIDNPNSHYAANNDSVNVTAENKALEGGDLGEAVATNLDDTAEEAALRREMLQYGLGEVSSIVAELEMEEDTSDLSYDEDQATLSFDSDFDEDEIGEEDESEDENGMVKHPTMSRKYLEKMKELEEKYGIRGMQNLGPDTSKLPKEIRRELDRTPAAEAARKAALAREEKVKDVEKAVADQAEPRSVKPKKVTFAEELDIAQETESHKSPRSASKSRPERSNLVEPIKNSIVERQSSTSPAASTQSTSQATEKKPSKFKAAREATPQTPLSPPSPTAHQLSEPSSKTKPEPNPPPHKIYADSVVERATTTRPSAPDPDDLDETIHRQEIAGEYYKLRNRMIQRQGGFVGGGEAENYGEETTPLPVIDENGKEKKISRFKAARLK